MNIWQSLILGFVQGVTEFLPVSSSGHLVIFQNWLDIYPTPLSYDLFLHMISVAVIIYYLRKIIIKLDISTLINLAISTIPILIVGFFIRNQVKNIFESSSIAGFGLLLTGLLNFVAAKYYQKQNLSKKITPKDALVIGLSQVVAIIPGVSRSGSTLFGASIRKIDKTKALEFSFLMAILAILASNIANVFLLDNSLGSSITFHWTVYLMGGIVCFITSLASIKLLKLTLNKTKYHWFGWYCILLGFLTILFG